MKMKQLFADDDAVSPVIGVILMVAITVILAAVIGTFVLGLGENVQETAPTASITFDQQGSDTVVISHDGGDTLEEGEITLSAEGTSIDESSTDWATSGEIKAGATVTVDGLSSGNVVKVVWESDGGESSSVLGDHEVQ